VHNFVFPVVCKKERVHLRKCIKIDVKRHQVSTGKFLGLTFVMRQAHRMPGWLARRLRLGYFDPSNLCLSSFLSTPIGSLEMSFIWSENVVTRSLLGSAKAMYLLIEPKLCTAAAMNLIWPPMPLATFLMDMSTFRTMISWSVEPPSRAPSSTSNNDLVFS
jgi:hypothetical protein